jgi:hypothetical protein
MDRGCACHRAHGLQLTTATSPSGPSAGIEGRGADEICHSTSKACQEWTVLARKCAENERCRDEGYMGRLEPYCTQMEEYRGRATGIASSSTPGAYNF